MDAGSPRGPGGMIFVNSLAKNGLAKAGQKYNKFKALPRHDHPDPKEDLWRP